MTRVNVKERAVSSRMAIMIATSLTVAGMIAPAAYSDKRQPAPVVFGSSGNTPVETAKPAQTQATTKKKRGFFFGKRKSSDSAKRVAPPASTKRVEFRYPDQPDTFYGEGGSARTVADAAPLSFSSSQAAVSQQEAALMTVGARPNVPTPAPTPVVSQDPAISAGGFDARAAAARVESKSKFVSAAGPVDFTSPAVTSQPLAPIQAAPAPVATLQDVSAAAPAEQNAVYDKTGSASVFNRALHGQPTSNGEVLDTQAMTAAHPTLPLPSLVQVINLENGKEVVVRVNDRGPIGGNGLIEVSEKAADVLGFNSSNLAKVRVRYLGEAPALQPQSVQPVVPVQPANVPLFAQVPAQAPTVAPRAPLATNGQFVVQLASFSDIGNAQRMYESLSARLGNVGIVSANVNGTDYFRIVAGPLNDRKSAENLRDQLARQGVGQGLVITAP